MPPLFLIVLALYMGQKNVFQFFKTHFEMARSFLARACVIPSHTVKRAPSFPFGSGPLGLFLTGSPSAQKEAENTVNHLHLPCSWCSLLLPRASMPKLPGRERNSGTRTLTLQRLLQWAEGLLPHESYAHLLTPQNGECDLMWEKNCCGGN